MNARSAACLAPAIFAFATTARAQGVNPPGNQEVSARFVSDVLRARPGATFTLGVELTLAPGWHVYWKSPGDAGLATTVSLKLPAGVTADAWRYPTPSRFDQGGVIAYGYQRQVLLMTTLHVPSTWTDGVLPIQGSVKFLVCKEQCMPGRIPLATKIPIGAEAAPANQELFEPWKAAVPVQATLLDGSIPAAQTPRSGQLRIQLPGPVPSADFFPVLPPALEMTAVKVTMEGSTAVVTFQSKRLQGENLDDKPVEAVLGYDDDHGRRRGVRVDVPVDIEK